MVAIRYNWRLASAALPDRDSRASRSGGHPHLPPGDMTHDRYLYLPTVGLSAAGCHADQALWPIRKTR